MTQCEKVLNDIEVNGPISAMDAFSRLGITSLHRRLSDLEKHLEKQGYKKRVWKCSALSPSGKITHFNRYSFEEVKNYDTGRL